MGSNFIDPGGGSSAQHSYANRLKTTKFEKLNRNVLEIKLEKQVIHKHVSLDGDEVSKVCEKVGIKVGSETEGYQAHYN